MKKEKTVLNRGYRINAGINAGPVFFWEVKTKKEKFVLTEVESTGRYRSCPSNKEYLNVTITFSTLAEATAYINKRIAGWEKLTKGTF